MGIYAWTLFDVVHPKTNDKTLENLCRNNVDLVNPGYLRMLFHLFQ